MDQLGRTEGGLDTPGYDKGHRAQEIVDTTKKLIVADMVILGDRVPPSFTWNDEPPEVLQEPKLRVRNLWHNLADQNTFKVSMGFADGHVKAQPRRTGAGGRLHRLPHDVDIDKEQVEEMRQEVYY